MKTAKMIKMKIYIYGLEGKSNIEQSDVKNAYLRELGIPVDATYLYEVPRVPPDDTPITVYLFLPIQEVYEYLKAKRAIKMAHESTSDLERGLIFLEDSFQDHLILIVLDDRDMVTSLEEEKDK